MSETFATACALLLEHAVTAVGRDRAARLWHVVCESPCAGRFVPSTLVFEYAAGSSDSRASLAAGKMSEPPSAVEKGADVVVIVEPQ